MTALGLFNSEPRNAEAQLVWTSSDWNLAEFQKVVTHPARVKQLFDVRQIGGGNFLGNIKNSLTALHFGFGVPEQQIKIVGGLHGPANLLNYDDCVWEKYQIGEWLDVTDPATGKPATRNLFYNSKLSAAQRSATKDPNDPNSMYQDSSMEALRSRGVQFMSCHTALEEQVRVLVRRNHLSQPPEEIAKDMLAHTVPGTLVVASMVAAITLLQSEGRYTYITV
jgi:intracellular sulfur oxidation DsrE/DsrF family protein